MREQIPKPFSVAVIGLGIMGSAFAGSLIKAGYTAQGFDPDSDASRRAENMGVRTAPTMIEAVRGADVILASLPSESALAASVDALTHEREKFAEEPVIVELSTLSLECKGDAHRRLRECGIEMLDCPVSGTGAQAAVKDIVLYASGDESVFDQCRPVFDAIARQSFYLGTFGNGTKMKFIANLLVAVHNVATAEAYNLARCAGMELSTVHEVIKSGAGASRILELRGPMMVKDAFTPATMKLDVWQKDMDLIAEFAESRKAATPLFRATQPLYEKAIEMGLGSEDTAAVIQVLGRAGASI
jgi:putative dehydrogenase